MSTVEYGVWSLIDEGDDPICEGDALRVASHLVTADGEALELARLIVEALIARGLVVPGSFTSTRTFFRRSSPPRFEPWSGGVDEWRVEFRRRWDEVTQPSRRSRVPVFPYPGQVLWMRWLT